MAIRWDDLDFDDDLTDEDLWFAALAAERPHVASPFLSLLDAARPRWHAEAACRDHPTLSWFAAADREATAAVCATCPACEACARAGAREALGMWGGQARGFPRPRPA